jgi:polar amino acid transport system substrate-binding protein
MGARACLGEAPWRRLLALWALVLPMSYACADSGVMHLVCDEWPPFEYSSGKGVDGFGVAVSEAVMASMGVYLARPDDVYPWARALALTEAGQADVLISALWSPERERWAIYPEEPLAQTRYAVFGRVGGRMQPAGPAQVHDMRLGVVYRFHYTDNFIEQLPKSVSVVSAFTPSKNLQNLARGMVDVAIEDQYTAQYTIRRLHLEDRIRIEPLFRLSSNNVYALFSRQTVDPALVERFSHRLHEFKQTDGYRALAAQYGIAP